MLIEFTHGGGFNCDGTVVKWKSKVRYQAISDSVGVPIKPQNPLDMSGAFIFAWLFFSFPKREEKDKQPPSGEQK